MKVAFLFGGLPHYYVLLLNKLNSVNKNLEIIVYHPENSTSGSLGKNVHQEKDNVHFKSFGLKEGKNFFGKPKILGLKKRLELDLPDLIIVVWPYTLSIFLDLKLLNFLKKKNIKIFEKSIPYQVPNFENAWEYYLNTDKILDENLKPLAPKSLATSIKYYLLTLYRKYQFNKADGHVCYLPEAFDILGSYGVPKNKIHIILNSPITENFLKANEAVANEIPLLEKNPYRIIHIGRLVKWKKVHLLIEAIKRLQLEIPLIELLVLGDGPELENLIQQAKDGNLEEKIKFVGSVYEPIEIARHFASSSLYVLAGTGGLSINDAMSLKKPIVCSECDGTEKVLVRDGINGYIFETDNVYDLAEKIRKIILNPALALKMGENSQEIIKNEVNENIVIQNYINAFKTIKDF
jgi:glycosyltransferase involved in cell wall biosynthesis